MRGLRSLLLIGHALSALACGGQPATDELPRLDLEGLDPEQRAAVQRRFERVAADPKDSAARFELAAVLDANELDAPAEEAWADLARREPADPRASYHLARIRERRGDFEGAMAALGRVLELASEYGPAHARFGRLLLEAGKLPEARAAFE